MSTANFQLGMKFIALHEWGNKPDGQYTNDSRDSGGETKFGIAKASHPNLDIKNLTLAQAWEIYKRDYWDAYGLDSVPVPLCIALFDAFVNMRPSTVKLLRDRSGGDWSKFIGYRKDFYGRLVNVNPKNQVFLKGWLNRCNDLWTLCHELSLNS